MIDVRKPEIKFIHFFLPFFRQFRADRFGVFKSVNVMTAETALLENHFAAHKLKFLLRIHLPQLLIRFHMPHFPCHIIHRKPVEVLFFHMRNLHVIEFLIFTLKQVTGDVRCLSVA